MSANISQYLNQCFACPGCHTSGKWRPTARAMARETSTIQSFRCRSCGEEIVVKVARKATRSEVNGQLMREEYRVLCELRSTFPQDDQFGTLLPLGYLELGGFGAMITRKFDGVDLIRQASKLSSHEVRGLFGPAGLLLRKLHDSCPKGYQTESLGVQDKVVYLAQTYGTDLRGVRAGRVLIDQFEEQASRINTFLLRATWSHGDFKPENVLCDGHKYLVLDTQLEHYGPFVYDLASFLNHLLIAERSLGGSGLRHRYRQVAEDFLVGYGGVDQQELVALRWAQLYFMLCYWGRYRLRGPFWGAYADWKIRPLAQRLCAQL